MGLVGSLLWRSSTLVRKDKWGGEGERKGEDEMGKGSGEDGLRGESGE